MNRSRARAGSTLLFALATWALLPSVAHADAVPDVWFAGTRLIFDHAELRGADIAVATDDAGLARFLARVGATLSYQPGQRYIVVTAADRRTITLTVGDTRVTAGGITTATPFAPYVNGSEAFLPLASLARALYVAPVLDGGTLVLQPQFGALDVRSDQRATVVTLHGATPLSFRRVTQSAGRLTLSFSGLASSLEQSRTVATPALSAIDVLSSGFPRTPTTVVTFETPQGAQSVMLPSSSPNDLTLAFALPGTALRGAQIPSEGSPPAGDQEATQPAEAAPAAAATPAAVSAVDLVPSGDSATEVRIAMSGGADFEWHRLNDGRWYVDLRGATLAMLPRDEQPQVGGIEGLRVRQFALDPVPVVRVSLSLASSRRVDIAPSQSGLTVTVSALDDPSPARVGVGHIGAGAGYPELGSASVPGATPWKFGPEQPAAPAAANPRLIVLDPGHGGSDVGAQHNGLTEKDVTLDIARRLRSVLTARGWTVRMTRDSDTDVYAPNDSAHDELQARCDIANKAGARMFLSIHANSFTSSSLSGTTTYYYKGVDLALAQAVHRHLIEELGTKDDGVRKDNFYVIHHTTMPAILVETAFISNAGDAARLHSAEFLQRVASAIADGVAEYAKLPQSAAANENQEQ